MRARIAWTWRIVARRVLLASMLPCIIIAGCASPSGAGRTSGVGTNGRGAGVAPNSVAALRRAIDSMISAPRFRNAHWGILIVDPSRADTLASVNAAKLFLPASNMKLVTGAVALARLGSDFRFRTTVAARGWLRDSVLAGDLVIHGRGDPTVSARLRGDALAPLYDIADSLIAHGIRRVTGRILAGTDAFPDAGHGAGWAWDDFAEGYSAGVDELFFNEGSVRIDLRAATLTSASTHAAAASTRAAAAGAQVVATLTPLIAYPTIELVATTVERPDTMALPGGASAAVASTRITVHRDSASGTVRLGGTIVAGDSVVLTVPYPSQRDAYIAALAAALAARGITVESGGALKNASPPVLHASNARAPTAVITEDTLFVVRSAPLSDVLIAMQKPSQNQIAEILLKTVGLEVTGVGSADSGRAVVERQLLLWGAAPDGFVVRDGSGLSRYNFLAPETIVRTLVAMMRDPASRSYYDALPIAGVDGTIASRMRGTPAQGNVHAKTGFVAQARSLSGYVTAADGRMLVFSLLCNNWTAPRREVERVQDSITERLASLSNAPR